MRPHGSSRRGVVPFDAVVHTPNTLSPRAETSLAALEEVAAQIVEAGDEAYVVPADISKPEDPENLMAAAVEKYGAIDVLVNNAGILEAGLKPIDRYTDEDLDRIVETNQKGTMRCMRAATKRMTSGASIVNVASIAGEKGCGGAASISRSIPSSG